jgi:hypothetical protein
MSWITAAEFARRVKCSAPNVTQGIKRGKIAPEFLKRDGRSLYINTAAVEEWQQTGRTPNPPPPETVREVLTAQAEARPRPSPPPAPHRPLPPGMPTMLWGRPSSPPGGTDDEGESREELAARLADLEGENQDGIPRHEAERQIAILRMRLLRIDVAEREGELVRAGDVRSKLFERDRRVRDLLMGIPVRIAADLASESDPAAVSILLEQVLTEALLGLKPLPGLNP